MRKLLISMVASFLFWYNQANFLSGYKVRTRIIVLEPRKNNCQPTELDVSISATESPFLYSFLSDNPKYKVACLGYIFFL